jgi:hypothetical protein
LVFEKHLSKNAPRTSIEKHLRSWSSDIPPAALFPPFHPTYDVQQDIHPTDNPPPSARKSEAGEARRPVGRRRGGLPSSARQSLRALVMQSSAPAPGAPSPWDSALDAIEDISQCTFLQMTYTAETPHTDGSAAPGARPRFRPPRRRDPHATFPRTHDSRMAGRQMSCRQQTACGPSTVAMQQRCHRTSASARSPSWPPMPRPLLHESAEKDPLASH